MTTDEAIAVLNRLYFNGEYGVGVAEATTAVNMGIRALREVAELRPYKEAWDAVKLFDVLEINTGPLGDVWNFLGWPKELGRDCIDTTATEPHLAALAAMKE